MNLVQFVGKSFNVEKENENDCVVKETEIRERGCKPACHHFPAEVSSSSSFPPGYIVQVQITRKKEGTNYEGEKKEFPTEVTAFMSPCLNQMANLSFF